MRLAILLLVGLAAPLIGCSGDSACRGDNCKSESKVFDVEVNDYGNGQYSATMTPAGASKGYSICQTGVGWCAIPPGPLGVPCYCNAFPGFPGQVVQ